MYEMVLKETKSFFIISDTTAIQLQWAYYNL